MEDFEINNCFGRTKSFDKKLKNFSEFLFDWTEMRFIYSFVKEIFFF